ncbi:AraC family transcriptional regulator [Ligilactobacillus equi]
MLHFTSEHFATVFKKHTGQTPSAYRTTKQK